MHLISLATVPSSQYSKVWIRVEDSIETPTLEYEEDNCFSFLKKTLKVHHFGYFFI